MTGAAPESTATESTATEPTATESTGFDRRRLAFIGAVLGASTGPVAGYGQLWAGIGDARAHVWILATVFGALLGAATYPLFMAKGDGTSHDPFGAGFAALFGFAVGLVAGAFAAFPMGGVLGGFGGALAAAATAFAARRLVAVSRFGLAIAWLVGAGGALGVAAAWLA